MHPATRDAVGIADFILVTIPVNQPRTVLDEIEVINFDSNCVFIGNRRYTFPAAILSPPPPDFLCTNRKALL